MLAVHMVFELSIALFNNFYVLVPRETFDLAKEKREYTGQMLSNKWKLFTFVRSASLNLFANYLTSNRYGERSRLRLNREAK